MTDDEAETYRREHGHYPMHIGREYYYWDSPVELLEFNVDLKHCIVKTRYDDCADVFALELSWKPKALKGTA